MQTTRTLQAFFTLALGAALPLGCGDDTDGKDDGSGAASDGETETGADTGSDTTGDGAGTDTSGAGTTGTDSGAELEIAGTWLDDFGAQHEITDATWTQVGPDYEATFHILSFDNDADFLVARNDGGNDFGADLFSRFDWTIDDDGGVWYCQTAFDAPSAPEAEMAAPPDASDPASGGCADFPWTSLGPA